MKSRSYSSIRLGPVGRLREFAALYRLKREGIPQQVANTRARLEQAAREVEHDLGHPVQDGDVLVVGPGQHLSEMRFWSQAGNRVVGIDLDPYPSKPSVADYLRVVRNDGLVRAVKTLGRRLTRIDASYQRELQRQLPVGPGMGGALRSMDAASMTFEEGTFDLVYSRSVFEHLRDPKRVIEEIARVLRPGGVAHIELHLYTCDGGCHDARIFAGERAELPFWSHLRPRYRDRVRPNSYLNEIRLGEWRELFEGGWPGCAIELRSTTDPRFADALVEIRADGELGEYSDEELLTVGVVARWRRPPLT